MSCAPAAMLHVAPGWVGAIDTTVSPGSPAGKAKVSDRVTAAAADGPLLR